MTAVSVKEAKNTFTALLRMVEAGEPVEILRHGKSVAVISSTEYFKAHTKTSSFEEELMEWRRKNAEYLLTEEEHNQIFNIERKVEPIRHEEDLWGTE